MSLRPTRYAEVRQYLDQGLKYSAIRRLTGVNRDTIRRIDEGTHKQPDLEDEIELPRVPAYRCVCGYVVEYDPCQICAALAHRERTGRGDRQSRDPDEPLTLQLREDLRPRYQAARTHRERLEAAGNLLHCL